MHAVIFDLFETLVTEWGRPVFAQSLIHNNPCIKVAQNTPKYFTSMIAVYTTPGNNPCQREHLTGKKFTYL